jgi:hypothetical protein
VLSGFDAPRNPVENHRSASADLEIANFENGVLLSLHGVGIFVNSVPEAKQLRVVAR